MLLTRECDYGFRIVRQLADGGLRQMSSISEDESIPKQYCYKIVKKLERGGIVVSVRGRDGGYKLNKKISEFSLYDIVTSIIEDTTVNHCLKNGAVCSRNTDDEPCMVHAELQRIQDVITREMKSKTVSDVMQGK